MPIEPTVEGVIAQLELVSAHLSGLSYVLSAFSGAFEYETEPPYNYVIHQVVESATDLHSSIADLISKMKPK
jgi:hypothetical protein